MNPRIPTQKSPSPLALAPKDRGNIASMVAFAVGFALSFSVQAQPYTWTTAAGSGGIGTADGTNLTASFFQPYGIAVDNVGNLFVADTGNDRIRKLTQSGTNWLVSTIAGSDPGFIDAADTAAQFDYPVAIAVDAAGALYVADYYNDAIRKVTPTGGHWVVVTLAGNGSRGSSDGTNGAAQFYHPTGIAVDGQGKLYVADNGNNTIRRLTPQGTNWVVTTLAGLAGTPGTEDGTNSTARFAGPWGIAVDGTGRVYVSDFSSSRLRKLTLVGTNWVVTTIAGSGYGSADGINNNAQFNFPMGLALDSAGKLYVADYYNDEIRQAEQEGTDWVVTTIGGSAGITGDNDGIGSNAWFALPRGIAATASGSLFVADTGNNIIRSGLPGLVLRISVSGTQIILTCPGPAASYVLETTAAVLPFGTFWTPVTTGVTISGNNFILNNNRATGTAFFRLRQ